MILSGISNTLEDPPGGIGVYSGTGEVGKEITSFAPA
jgi:hypothetical protein